MTRAKTRAKTGVTKAKTGVTLDKDIFQVFLENPYMKRSQWINDVIRREMISQGMLKVEA